MSQPLIATHRVTVTYVVHGLAHKFSAYASASLVLGVWSLADRDGIVALNWTACAQALWDAIRAILDNTTPAASAILEERSGLLWTLTDTFALSGIGQQTPAYSPACQLSIILRDTAFLKIRALILEASEPYVGHSADGTGINSGITNTVAFWTGANTGAQNPYRWQKSRGNRFIKATGMVAGATLDLNDKLKRARGLE